MRYAEYIDDFITLFDENIRSTILIDLSLIFSSTLVISLPLTPNLVFKTSTTALGSNPLNGVSSAATPNHALSNLVSTYHYSIPNVKLSYPEPFTASASFMHADLWFIHILTYQYWLWFVFCFLIVFFFITFLAILRWCLLRVRPRRETRGVSRSKCGDLITACVPVSWAASIIVNESTDAIDYFDGFGTAEMVMGIRAYQWGWEYYYPRDLDLTYDVRPSYSLFIGNSLKYYTTTSLKADINVLFRFYQMQSSDFTVTPLSLLTSSGDLDNIISKINFNESGMDSLLESYAFSNVRKVSKIADTAYLEIINDNNQFKTSHLFFLIEKHFVAPSSLSYQLTMPTSRLLGLTSVPFSYVDNASMKQWEAQNNLYENNSFKNLLLDSITNSLVKHGEFNDFNPFNQLLPYSQFFSNFKSTHFENFCGHRFNLFFNMQNLSLVASDRVVEKVFSETLQTLYLNLFMFKNQTFSNYNLVDSNSPKANLLSSATGIHDNFVSPIISNFPFYSNTQSGKSDSFIFKQSEELINPALFTHYWSKTGALINPSWRFFFSNFVLNAASYLIMPPFSLFYDYEFLNWQSAPLIENFFWDTNNSNLLVEEYFNFFSNDLNIFIKNDNIKLFSILDRKKFKSFKNLNNFNYFTANFNPLYFDSFLPFSAYSTYLYSNFFPMQWAYNLDESYELLKINLFSLSTAFNNFKVFSNNNVLFRSSNVFLNTFRSNFDYNYFNINFSLPISYDFNLFDNFSNNENLQHNETFVLRLPAKNMITQYNAIHKVFRARYDEMRSLVFKNDFASMNEKQPIISSKRIGYKTLLAKNNINFLFLNFNKPIFNDFTNSAASQRFLFPTFDFPFLLSLKSDSARNLWIDWFSRWNHCDIQPSSSARYSIIGLPLLNKGFDFAPKDYELLDETENYFIRISRARKNYSSNWLTTPFFLFLRSMENNLSWISLLEKNIFFRLISLFNNEINLKFSETYLFSFVSALSSNYANNHIFLQPQDLNFTKNSDVSILLDLLSKREFFFRSLMIKRNTPFSIPNEIRVSPNNKLMNSFLNLNFFSLNTQNNYILSFSTRFYSLAWKDQYRPMKRGINSLLRLQATGAIAVPSEIRLQILASSKDVIHSWAVPSAGVKIDCVPGYSSHKIFIFLLSGIYWGQCMEICGRYHHWMPIVVYFMKRDMFVLWCSHFILFSRDNNISLKLAPSLSYSSEPVSYGLNSWLSEF